MHTVTQKFDQICTEQLALCDALEDIADSLPHDVDSQKSLSLSRALYAQMERAHQFEEEELFPLLAGALGADADSKESFRRLRFEHLQDACFAEEISEALREFAVGENSLSPDALGYLLRGFFVGVRRHVEVERDLVALALRPDKN
ncbi:hemerythrin domain-containing protein [bacterium]|nr:hemerythrin domain-containing protein [bacterium]